MAKKSGKADRLRELREMQATQPERPPPLSRHERSRLDHCEEVIERGLESFLEVGAALAEVKESKLYRESYGTFADYCRQRWGMHRTRAYQLIGASSIVAEMSTMVDKRELVPANERQARELAKAPEDKRSEVMEKAAANGRPTASSIRAANEELTKNDPPSERLPEGVEDIDGDPDPYDEMERLLRENRRLSELVDQFTESDVDAELVKWSERYARLEGRVSQLAQTTKQAESTAKYATGVLRKVRDALGVERDREILPAIQALTS